MGVCESLSWIARQQLACGALPVGSDDRRADAAATAYAAHLLLRAERPDAARLLLGWLADAQAKEGYWQAPGSSEPSWLDTAIAVGSLLELATPDPEHRRVVQRLAARAVSWLEGALRPGMVPPIEAQHYDAAAPAEANMLGLAQIVRVRAFREALQAWSGMPDVFACTGIVQHFYCYMVEAIARLNERYAWWIAARFARSRGLDGSVVAYYEEAPMGRIEPGASWHSFPAVAHWAAIWAQLGYRDAAMHALAYLDSRQTGAGGITGGDGPYQPDQELTWPALYHVRAYLELATGPAATKGAPAA
jgi:hypothetical protein